MNIATGFTPSRFISPKYFHRGATFNELQNSYGHQLYKQMKHYPTVLFFFYRIWQMKNIWSLLDLVCQHPHWWTPITLLMYGVNAETMNEVICICCKWVSVYMIIKLHMHVTGPLQLCIMVGGDLAQNITSTLQQNSTLSLLWHIMCYLILVDDMLRVRSVALGPPFPGHESRGSINFILCSVCASHVSGMLNEWTGLCASESLAQPTDQWSLTLQARQQSHAVLC
jgi:hypothetical protein